MPSSQSCRQRSCVFLYCWTRHKGVIIIKHVNYINFVYTMTAWVRYQRTISELTLLSWLKHCWNVSKMTAGQSEMVRFTKTVDNDYDMYRINFVNFTYSCLPGVWKFCSLLPRGVQVFAAWILEIHESSLPSCTLILRPIPRFSLLLTEMQKDLVSDAWLVHPYLSLVESYGMWWTSLMWAKKLGWSYPWATPIWWVGKVLACVII